MTSITRDLASRFFGMTDRVPFIQTIAHPLLVTLVVAFILRVGYLPQIGHAEDMRWNLKRSNVISLRDGWFKLYATLETDYPPLFMGVLGAVATIQRIREVPLTTEPNGHPYDVTLVVILKVVPLLCEFGLIAAAFFWLRKKRWLRWLVPLGLALSPGLLMDAAWWGQSDSVMTVLLMMSLIALNRDKPRYAWIFFTIGMLTKFQSVALFPVLLAVTFGRYGWRKTTENLIMGLVIGLLALAPFIAVSGWAKATYPYLGVVGKYPSITVNGFNFWYFFAHREPGMIINWPDETTLDTILAFGVVSYRMLGFAMLGLYALLVMLTAWRQAGQRREFIWAAAIYMGFFMLPTQVHERYMYPALVFMVIGIAQDRRLWPLALVGTYTFAYNLIPTMDNHQYASSAFWTAGAVMFIALLNCLILIDLTRILIRPPGGLDMATWRAPRWLSAAGHGFWRVSRVALIVTLGIVCVLVAAAGAGNYPTALWLSRNVADRSWLASENLEVVSYVNDLSRPSRDWIWALTATIEEKPATQRLGEGNHYLLMNEWARPGVNFAGRVQTVVDSGATVVYQSTGIPFFTPSTAVLWTFRPQHPTDYTFGDTLRLVGYNWVKTAEGKPAILLHWYTLKPSVAPLQYFFHRVHGATDALIAQTDGALGEPPHATTTWRPGEIVFQTVASPEAGSNGSASTHLKFGVYRSDSGSRLGVSDKDGRALGDTIEIVPPDGETN